MAAARRKDRMTGTARFGKRPQRAGLSWVARSSLLIPIATNAASIFMLAVVATALGRERHGVAFGGSEGESPPLLEE
jgi:hypothetical protein